LHHLVSELGSINQVISFQNFYFLLIPQKFFNIQILLLLEFAAYKKKIVISFCYCSKYISSIKNKKKREKRKEKKIVQKDVN